jgi:drug/metabolite transporter (DMT)-like permease
LITSEPLAVLYGLASAASWGAGDFSGGLAAKRSSVYSVVIISQLVGGICLGGLALLFSEPFPDSTDLLYGSAAGIAGVIGLVALYRGLAVGHMGVVAPVAAVVSAVVPVIVSLFIEGLPGLQQIIGFGLAAVAIWLLSGGNGEASVRMQDLGLPVVAGLGFGLFFILIDRVSDGSVFWPLVAARVASIALLLIFVLLTRQAVKPNVRQLPIIALAGVFDSGGNAFFALATQLGRLDISAVLSSLYPATTVILAWFILKERLMSRQWGGVVTALIAVVLIAL